MIFPPNEVKELTYSHAHVSSQLTQSTLSATRRMRKAVAPNDSLISFTQRYERIDPHYQRERGSDPYITHFEYPRRRPCIMTRSNLPPYVNKVLCG